MQTWILWTVFGAVIALTMAIDLGLLQRRTRAHEVKFREALILTLVWITLATLFGGFVWRTRGPEAAATFFACYLTEEALSIDNMFVFLVIFTTLGVPGPSQHRVLFWGILGALIMRAVFIMAGIGLIEMFHWTIYILGAFLVFTGVRLAMGQEKEIHPEKSAVLRFARRIFPVTAGYEGARFFVRRDGKLFATPLFIALLAVETTDVLFAVDSVPAVLALSTDPFLVYTSNIFAILGLRSLYFVLHGAVRYLRYLHHGLAAILVFVGIKMILDDVVPIPVSVSLGVVVGLLAVCVIASLLASTAAPQSQLQEAERDTEPADEARI